MTNTEVHDFEFCDEDLRTIDEDIKNINEEDKQNYDELTNKYENTYKNILWIDDRAKQEAGADTDEKDKIVTKPEGVIKLEWMRHYLSDPDSAYHIEQISQFEDAVELIVKHPQYDLVIFDINLVEGFKSTEMKDKLRSNLEQHYLAFDYDNINKEIAGIYLYLLLLSVGYPINRMVVYTGNGLEIFKNTPLGQCFDFHSSILLEKSPNQKNMDIESYFSYDKNGYYRIRRLVFHACDYWRDRYTKDDDIPFNKLYYSKGGKRQKKMFTGLLDHIKMLFPVRMPEDPEKVYYQAMQIVASFHEESAHIQDIKPKIQCYHSCVRNFRNWAAHLKLKNAKEQKLDGEQFALLFCLAMRTYFDDSQVSNADISNDLFPYEKQFKFIDTGFTAPDEERLKKLIQHIYFNVLRNLVPAIKKDKKNNKNFLLVRDAICEYGNLQDAKMNQQHLFLPLWFYDIQAECDPPQMNNDKVILGYTVTCKFEDICKKISPENKDDDAAAVFMRYCFRWLENDT